MMLSDVCLSVCLSVCLTSVAYIGPKSRTERPRKTKIGTPLSRSKGQRSKSPGRFTHRDVNASGSCSGERGNILIVGTYCYVAVCRRGRLGGARRFGAHRGRRRAGTFVAAGRLHLVAYRQYYRPAFKSVLLTSKHQRQYAYYAPPHP